MVLLLERCVPGTPLAGRPEPEQDAVIAALLPRLWRDPPAGHSFRPLRDLCEAWADAFERAPRAANLDPSLADEGIELFRSLPETADRQVLLCTDLHAGNVLAAQREPWLMIDPKPYVGDPTYDALQHLLNCDARLRTDPHGLAKHWAELLGLDGDRLLLWLFARCVQESAEFPALADIARSNRTDVADRRWTRPRTLRCRGLDSRSREPRVRRSPPPRTRSASRSKLSPLTGTQAAGTTANSRARSTLIAARKSIQNISVIKRSIVASICASWKRKIWVMRMDTRMLASSHLKPAKRDRAIARNPISASTSEITQVTVMIHSLTEWTPGPSMAWSSTSAASEVARSTKTPPKTNAKVRPPVHRSRRLLAPRAVLVANPGSLGGTVSSSMSTS